MYIKRLRDLREDNDLKQLEVAKYLHCSESTYRRYEKGYSEIPLMKFLSLLRLYQVDVDYMLGYTAQKPICIYRRISWSPKRLMIVRREFHYGQKEVASALRITTNTYERYERGGRAVPLSVVIKLAEIYQTSIEHILQTKPIYIKH